MFLAIPIWIAGCYVFVSDETPPEWYDAKKASQETAATTAGGAGGSVYQSKCAVCHQATGKGIPGVYPSLVGSEIATGDPSKPIMIVLHGFQGVIERGGQQYNGVMQAWKNDLTDQQIADVLTFVRSSWGNAADAIDAATVKKIREASTKRLTALTEADLKAIL